MRSPTVAVNVHASVSDASKIFPQCMKPFARGPPPSAQGSAQLWPKDCKFTGRVRWVQIDLGADAEDADHLISPEERYRIAMARQ